MRKIDAIFAVREGTPIPDVAHQFGIHIATLYRWLKSFDPEHPIASLRPKKMGPKGPRWGDDLVLQVKELIRPYPNLLGRRRIAQALRKQGVVLSEPTVGQILVVARQPIAFRFRAAMRTSISPAGSAMNQEASHQRPSTHRGLAAPRWRAILRSSHVALRLTPRGGSGPRYRGASRSRSLRPRPSSRTATAGSTRSSTTVTACWQLSAR